MSALTAVCGDSTAGIPSTAMNLNSAVAISHKETQRAHRQEFMDCLVDQFVSPTWSMNEAVAII
jgi:hypothetical protein